MILNKEKTGENSEVDEVALLSSTYFGPVQWYQKLNRYAACRLERYDHFIKQTYRNRCVIAAANGPLSLSIPVERPAEMSASQCLMKDIRISNHGNWRHIHWQALVSSYSESPFFEYYADDIRPFFEHPYTFLFDFNWEITRTICTLLDLQPNIQLTDEYVQPTTETTDTTGQLGNRQTCSDFRSAIDPKHPQPDFSFEPKPYYQVYRKKHGFLPNLSILDLLFNEGNEAILYL